MKRISLLITLLLTFLFGYAQEEVAIEQTINQRIDNLKIYSGWDVRLIHHEADSGYRVAIVTEEDLAARAYNVQLCNVKDQTLTILENTQLPKGTVVEVEGPMKFKQLALMDRATAQADQVFLSQISSPKCIFVSNDSRLHIQHLNNFDMEDSQNLQVWNNAQLTVDTLSGTGDMSVECFDHSVFHYETLLLNGKITLHDYEETPGWHYWKKDERVIRTKEKDGQLVSTNHRKVWDPSLQINVSGGILLGNTPKDANSPFLQHNTLSLKLSVETYFDLSNRWGVRTGLAANSYRKSLSHQVKCENNELVVIDGQEDFQRNRLTYTYVGIPVSLYFYLDKQLFTSVSLDCFVGMTGSGRLQTSVDPTRFFGFNSKHEKIDVFNPWKVEVGLGFNTHHLGIIHGVRVFTNLLPEYKPGVVDGKIRNFGLEVTL